MTEGKSQGKKSKEPSLTRALKAEYAELVEFWFLSPERRTLPIEMQPPDWLTKNEKGNILFFTQNEKLELTILEAKEIVLTLTAASIVSLKVESVKKKYTLAARLNEKDALNIVHSLNARVLAQEQFETELLGRVIQEEIKPIAFIDDPALAFKRLSFSLSGSLLDFDPFSERCSQLGTFMRTLKRNMLDYNAESDKSEHFKRLLIFVGFLHMSTDSPKEVLVWHGEGNDGKSTFIEFLGSQMGAAAILNADPNSIQSDLGKAALFGKRLVHFEEPTHGKLITSDLKRIAGSTVLRARKLYQDYIEFANTAMLCFTTNHFPEIDGKTASKSRLLVIQSKSVCKSEKMTPQESRKDLTDNWEKIVKLGCQMYKENKYRLLEMRDEEFDESVSDFYAKVDGWLLKNFAATRGAFMPKSTIAALIPPNIYPSDVFNRLPQLFANQEQQRICPVESRLTFEYSKTSFEQYDKKHSLHGWHNISFRQDSKYVDFENHGLIYKAGKW